mmetsp:Transcript_10752/g.19857  ORF Transcript_10752/g.19857 Transcript_10752/m.19857 type:complete len:243 (+) Transcript_10752:763-1491(+)
MAIQPRPAQSLNSFFKLDIYFGISPLAAPDRSFDQEVPPTELIQGVFPTYGKSESFTASKQNCATSALGMLPASPSITLITPVGGSTVNPPGRTMQYSNPLAFTAASWLFLSVKIFFMTVIMSILKAKGAWSLESPAPILVTTAMRLMLFSFMAAMMLFVPSVSIESPTSEVFPPSATMTPSILFSNTLATSAAFVTSPPIIVKLGSERGFSASAPPDPLGVTTFDGFLVRPTILSPSLRPW